MVDRTGAGKLLVLFLTAVAVGGVTLVLVPLLSLTAAQLAKLHAAVQRFGTINAVHLDEHTQEELARTVLPRLEAIRYDSSESLVLLCSPQQLSSSPALLAALLRCRDRQTLRLIVVDEAHLYTMHGATFRDPIRFLRDEFFYKIYAVGLLFTPLLLAMTATMPGSLLEPFSKLTHVDFTLPRHQLWASARDFQQLNITMELCTKSHTSVKEAALRPVVALLREDSSAHVCIFVNFRSEVGKISGTIEDIMAEALLRVGVLSINGSMDKNEKFAFIRLFTSVLQVEGHSFRVLVATAAANTGIDQPLCV